MIIQKTSPHSIHGHLPKKQDANIVRQNNDEHPSFNSILTDRLRGSNLTVSKHATMRMKSLGIEMNDHLNHQLEKATEKAKQKNIKEGLILTDAYGFVVSVKNNTVVTVVDLKNMKDNVFTNIDGAVII